MSDVPLSKPYLCTIAAVGHKVLLLAPAEAEVRGFLEQHINKSVESNLL